MIARVEAAAPFPANVRAFTTVRHGAGGSAAPFDSFNLGNFRGEGGDDPAAVARNRAELVEQLAARDVHRQYLAVVVGALVSGGTADAPIDRHPRDRLKMAVREDGRDAVTHYRLRERFRAHTALECRLETGRTHQIRVHMAHLRHPIVGDPMYGGPLKLPKGASEELVAALRGFKRQALHAETLEFVHPVSGEAIRCTAPVPDDLQALLAALRADAAAHAEAGRPRR